MQGYVISISNNRLKVSLLSTEEVYDAELAPEAVEGSTIKDCGLVAEALGELMLTAFGEKAKKLPFNFVVEPEDTIVGFITNSKDESSERFFEEACAKQLAKYALTANDVYYSYKKIAPFVYQFIAVRQDVIENCITIANELGFELDSVVPWAMLLPRYVSNAGEPKIFLTNEGDGSVLALSELNGIYHIGNLDEEGSKLKEMIQELSVYERNNPIKKVYTFGFDKFEMGDDFEVEAIDLGGTHDLFSETMTDDIIASQINLLNLLPVPVEVKSKSPAIYAGAAVGVLLLVVGGYFGFQALNGRKNSAMAPQENVLSESKEATESENMEENNQTEQEDTSAETDEQNEKNPNLELNREYLSIMIENGTSISGLADRTRMHLSQLGYDIDSIDIDDADTSEQVNALVSFSPDYALYEDLLVSDLKKMYKEVEVNSDLPTDYGYNVLIVVGSNLD